MTEQSKAKTLIEEARELLANVSPRPWESLHGDRCYHVRSADRAFETGCIMFAGGEGSSKSHADLIARTPDLLSQLCDELDQQVSLNKTQSESITEFQREQKAFRDALREAKEIIKIWHGPDAWDIYDQHSPEMIRINSALEAATKES